MPLRGLPAATVSLKGMSGVALVAQKLWPVLCLQQATSLLCVRGTHGRCVHPLAGDPRADGSYGHVLYLTWRIIVSTSCKTLFHSGDVFGLASVALWMTQR